MEFTIDNVRSITIKTNTSFYGPGVDLATDSLTITKSSIAYEKRTEGSNNSPTSSWFLAKKDPTHLARFKRLIRQCYKLSLKFVPYNDLGSTQACVEIIVELINGHETCVYASQEPFTKESHLRHLIRSLVPAGYDYSIFISLPDLTYFDYVSPEDEEYNEVIKNKCLAVLLTNRDETTIGYEGFAIFDKDESHTYLVYIPDVRVNEDEKNKELYASIDKFHKFIHTKVMDSDAPIVVTKEFIGYHAWGRRSIALDTKFFERYGTRLYDIDPRRAYDKFMSIIEKAHKIPDELLEIYREIFLLA